MSSLLPQVLFVVFDKAWVLGPASVLEAYLSTQDVVYQTKGVGPRTCKRVEGVSLDPRRGLGY